MTPKKYNIEHVTVNGVTWHVVSDMRDKVVDWLNKHLQKFSESDKTLIVKNYNGSRVGIADGLVLKERTVGRRKSVIRFGLNRSASRKAFFLGTELSNSGLLTPRPVAWATVRRYGVRTCDYLFVEELSHCRLLTDILKGGLHKSDLCNDIMSKLGCGLAMFHNAGFSNRDMKDRNIFIENSEDHRLWIIDLDGVEKLPFITRSRAMKDMWAIVRSIKVYGCEDKKVFDLLLSSYNNMVPVSKRLAKLPVQGAGKLKIEDDPV